MTGSATASASSDSVRVAVDLLGGDGAPDAILSGITAALRCDPALSVSLVGPDQLCRHSLTKALAAQPDPGDIAERVTVVPASQVVDMAENPVGAVLSKSDATVCVAADLVAAGTADAMVSIGSTGAAMAASVFSLGLLPGLTRPALAVTLPAATGQVVLLDVGANVVATPAILAQHALVGSAHAQSRLGLPRPRVGLLTNGAEPGKGDRVRRAAFGLLRALPVHFVGNIEGDDVLSGALADVIVTDGFTGNVLLKGMEGTFELLVGQLATSFDGDHEMRTAFVRATEALHPDRVAGAQLLGVAGVVVVGHGASSPAAVAACVAQAAGAVRCGALGALRTTLAALVSGPTVRLAEATP